MFYMHFDPAPCGALITIQARTHAQTCTHGRARTHSLVVESCTNGRWSNPRELQSMTRCDSRQRQMRGHQNPPTLGGRPSLLGSATEGHHTTRAARKRNNAASALNAICSWPRLLRLPEVTNKPCLWTSKRMSFNI